MHWLNRTFRFKSAKWKGLHSKTMKTEIYKFKALLNLSLQQIEISARFVNRKIKLLNLNQKYRRKLWIVRKARVSMGSSTLLTIIPSRKKNKKKN